MSIFKKFAFIVAAMCFVFGFASCSDDGGSSDPKVEMTWNGTSNDGGTDVFLLKAYDNGTWAATCNDIVVSKGTYTMDESEGTISFVETHYYNGTGLVAAENPEPITLSELQLLSFTLE